MAAVATADQPASKTPELLAQEKTPVPLQTPLPSPTPESKPSDRPGLAADQTEKYDWLLGQARAWSEIKSQKGKGGPITDDERMWLTRECLLRYLRATKWHEKEAEKRLLDTLTWRRDFGTSELTPEHISPENKTGKQFVLGYDKECRPCHYLNPGRQNTNPSHRQVEHLVFMVERVLDLMPAGQETLSLMINFKQSKNRSNTAPGIGIAREVLHILQTHYPERLGRALIINVPLLVWGFFKLITPFIDPRTRDKLKFNQDMSQYVPAEQLFSEYENGKLDFDYDHSVYWPALQALCKERREQHKARWVSGGKHIGEYEDYLVGACERGVGGPAKPDADDSDAAKSQEGNGARPVEATSAEEKAETEGDGKNPEEANPVETKDDEKRPEEVKAVETAAVPA